MTDFYSKARVAIVRLGQFEFNGLAWLNPENQTTYGIAIAQINELCQFAHTNNAAKQAKRLLGKDSPPIQMKTELNSNAAYVVTLPQFEFFLMKLDRVYGNPKAQEIRDALAGVALHQVFADAFGDKFDAEDRQVQLNERLLGKGARRTFTDAIKSYILRHRHELSDNAVYWMYINASDMVNQVLFGLRSAKMCEFLGCTSKELRDHFEASELQWIAQVEGVATRLMDECDVNPVDAVRQAHERILAPQSPRLRYLLTGEVA